MGIIKLERPNLVDEVYLQIKELITSGEWKEGQKLASEQKLGELFGVSRVVIREALQRVRSEKLIITRQGMGSFVSNPKNFEKDSFEPETRVGISESEYADLVEFRCCIEFRAIELAVKRATAEDLEKVNEALRAMEALADDIDALSEADYAFHYALVSCSKNPLLCNAIESCKPRMIQAFKATNKINDSLAWGIDVHRNVYIKLTERDARKAIQILKTDNEYNQARISQLSK